MSGADSTEAIKDHVRVKQEALLEKIKMKRAASLEPLAKAEEVTKVAKVAPVEIKNLAVIVEVS